MSTPLHGIVLLDKPKGLSSNQALQRVLRALGADKGGHTGALDPMATGMLPICLGEATKIAGYLLGQRKGYRATVELGATTDTDDAEGQVLERREVPLIDEAAVRALLAQFVGRIAQRAPVYSALKQGGRALYARARRGEVVEPPVREVEIEALELLGLEPNRLHIDVHCGSGTYIRSLARDLGERLGCGAHLSALRRTFVEPFEHEPMQPLDALLAAPATTPVLSIGRALARMPSATLDAVDAAHIAHGRAISLVAPWTGIGCLKAPDGRLLALAERRADGSVSIQRGFAAAVY